MKGKSRHAFFLRRAADMKIQDIKRFRESLAAARKFLPVRGSYLTAVSVALLTGIWMLSGIFKADDSASVMADSFSAKSNLPAVRFRESVAVMRQREIVIRGRTEADRKVTVRAETVGTVAAVPLEKGVEVSQGTSLCLLSVDARMESREESEAMMALRRLELEAAEKLAAQGHRAPTQLAQARAAYHNAEARLKKSQMDLENIAIVAPFDGFLENLHVEKGDYMNPGAPCATVIDLSPFVTAGQVSERDLHRLQLNMPAYAILKDGRRIEGRLRYISSVADSRTRTFRIEMEAESIPDKAREGMTAEIHIPSERVPVHKIPPAILGLSDDGEIGVRTLDKDNIAHFQKVEIISGEGEAVWIAGLPRKARLITVGQEYVGDGVQVGLAEEELLKSDLAAEPEPPAAPVAAPAASAAAPVVSDAPAPARPAPVAAPAPPAPVAAPAPAVAAPAPPAPVAAPAPPAPAIPAIPTETAAPVAAPTPPTPDAPPPLAPAATTPATERQSASDALGAES